MKTFFGLRRVRARRRLAHAELLRAGMPKILILLMSQRKNVFYAFWMKTYLKKLSVLHEKKISDSVPLGREKKSHMRNREFHAELLSVTGATAPAISQAHGNVAS